MHKIAEPTTTGFVLRRPLLADGSIPATDALKTASALSIKDSHSQIPPIPRLQKPHISPPSSVRMNISQPCSSQPFVINNIPGGALIKVPWKRDAMLHE